MSRRRRARGTSLVELLVGLALAATLAAAAVAAVATALRALGRAALRLEAADVAWLAEESFVFALRRAGFDPRDAGIDAVAEATPARLRLHADLDADGAVDPASEEATAFACDVPGGRLSRIAGGQSLPLASRVVACALRYADAAGAAIPAPPAGLDATDRRRVRRVTLVAALEPGGGGVPAAAEVTAALRVLP